MKRIIKNIIYIIALILCVIGMVFNIYNIKQNNDSVKITIVPDETTEDNDDGSKYDKLEIPSNATGQPAPEKPTIDKKPGSDECSPSTCEMKDEEKPEGYVSNETTEETDDNLKSKIHIYLIILDTVFVFIIVYLILSKFNLLSFKEVYDKKNKIIITLIIILCVVPLIYLGENYYLIENYKKSEGELNYVEGNYASHNLITSSVNIKKTQYISTKYQENSLLIFKAQNVELSKIKLYKTGGLDYIDHGVNGYNSALLATNNCKVTIKDSKVISAAKGANGIHANYSSTIDIYDTEITTHNFGSGGIMSTVDSTINAYNLTVVTNGNSSAAIRTDSTNGNINVNGGTYTTNGTGSPIIYSTGIVKIYNAKLTSNASEGVVIDGANNVIIEDSVLDTNNVELNGDTTVYTNIMLYNTNVGDNTKSINGSFTAKNSEIITRKGNTIYVLNDKANIQLENNKIINKDTEGNFIYVMTDNDNKKSDATVYLNNQEVEGNSIIDNKSSLEIIMYKSQYKGMINNKNESQNVEVSLGQQSKLILTGDSYIKSLKNEDKTNSNIDLNGYKLYVDGISLK